MSSEKLMHYEKSQKERCEKGGGRVHHNFFFTSLHVSSYVFLNLVFLSSLRASSNFEKSILNVISCKLQSKVSSATPLNTSWSSSSSARAASNDWRLDRFAVSMVGAFGSSSSQSITSVTYSKKTQRSYFSGSGIMISQRLQQCK